MTVARSPDERLAAAIAAEDGGRTNEAEAAYASLLEDAASAGDARLGADAGIRLARLESNRGLSDRASAHLDEALGLARSAGDPGLTARGLVQRAHLHRLHGRREEAAICLQEALTDYRALAGRTWAAEALTQLAAVLFDLGRLPEATARFVDAIRILREGTSDVRLSWALSSFANALSLAGRYSHAWGAIQESLFLAQGSGDSRTLLRSHIVHAIVCRHVGSIDEARSIVESLAEGDPAMPLHEGLVVALERTEIEIAAADAPRAAQAAEALDRCEWGALESLLGPQRLLLQAEARRIGGDRAGAAVLADEARRREAELGMAFESARIFAASSRALDGPPALAAARTSAALAERAGRPLVAAIALRRIAELSPDASEQARSGEDAERIVSQLAEGTGPRREAFLALDAVRYAHGRG